MDVLLYVLDMCVLVCLILGLVFAGKGVREKSDKALRREHMRRSGIMLCVYVVLNVTRLYLGGQLF